MINQKLAYLIILKKLILKIYEIYVSVFCKLSVVDYAFESKMINKITEIYKSNGL